MTWRATPAERRALAALDLHVPRHPEDLRRRDKVRTATLHSLCTSRSDRPPLALRLELKPATIWKTPYTPFFVLTEAGETLRVALTKVAAIPHQSCGLQPSALNTVGRSART